MRIECDTHLEEPPFLLSFYLQVRRACSPWCERSDAGSSARVVRLSLRKVFVVLLACGSSLPVVLVLESECCCVENIPVLHLTTGSVRSVYLGLHG